MAVSVLAGIAFVPFIRGQQAAATVNRQINFQGKIVDKTGGTNIANGTYNMQFKIYSGGNGIPGGGDETLLWTEARLRNNSQGVVFTDGVFQVNLGSVTTLPGSVDFNNSTLWLSMEMGNANASCTPFTSCSPDSEMDPMVRFTSSPYSFNSDLLDGIDSTAIGQLASNQTWTGTQTLQPTTNITSAIIKQTSVGSPTADILNVQTANSSNVIQITGPAANEAAVIVQSLGSGRDITLTSADQIILTAASTGTAALDINVSGTGGDLDIDVNDAITVDSASVTFTLAAGTTDFTIAGLDADSNLILPGLAGANTVVYAAPTTGVITTVTTSTGSQCLVSGAGASGVPTWGACGGGTTPDFDAVYAQSITNTNLNMEIDDTGGLTFDLTTTGNFAIRDGTTAFATFDNTGAITFAPSSGQDVIMNFAGNGRLDVNAVTYENGLGAIDLVRTGNFTGTTAETANELRIAPSLTLTEPGSGTFIWNGGNIDMSGIAVTAGGGSSVISGLRIAGVSDADAGTVNGLLVDNLTGTASAETALNVGTGWDVALNAQSGSIVTSNLGVEFTEAATGSGPTCAAGNYNIYADSTLNKLRKCVNGTASDIDAGTKYETFTGNGTYTKPSDAVMVVVEAIGAGGGGGGGGSIATATARTGGAAGGGGAFVNKVFAAANISGTETITVPAGGGAGTGGTNAAGADGSAPTADTSFGALLIAYRGGGGANGNNSATLAGGGGGGGSASAGGSSVNATGGAGGGPAGGAANGGTTNIAGNGGGGGGTSVVGQTSTLGGGGGGPSTLTTGLAGGSSGAGGGGGGSGGSCAASCTSSAGGAGGAVPGMVAGGGGTAGSGAGVAGGAGAAGTTGRGGAGGGGGSSNATASANGGAGGAGGAPGGGGGGGGAATFSATGTGGIGGTGGRGEIRVWTLRGSGADLAEMYCTNDSRLDSGDTVALDPDLRAGVKKTSKAYDTHAIGVIATSPGLVIGDIEEQCAKPVLVALAGRVPIKVSSENGPIKAGDLLTASSTPGVAMRATKAGQIVGQALAGFSGEGVGTTVAFIKTSSSNGSSAGLLDGLDTNATDFAKQTLAYLTNEQTLPSPPADMSEIVTDRVIAGLELVTPKVTADKVLTNSIEASTQSDITLKLADNGRVVMTDQAGKEVASFASDGNASIALDLGVEGSLTVGSTAKFNGSAIFSKLVTFVEKTVFKNDVTFEGHVLTSGETPAGEVKPAAGAEATVGVEGTDTSGQLTFKPGQGAAAGPVLSLEFKKPYAKTPRVLLTPANEFAANSKYFVEGTPTGFTITFSDPPTDSSAAQFNYWVVQ